MGYSRQPRTAHQENDGLVVKILSADVVNVFYLDYGNSGDVQVVDLRLLHKDFLALPAQVVSVRL